ncbi:MAG: hypothetical protein U9O78_04340 [Patescibacteria group bacterium]|nr:hypothetical protein [Patescibacteria group bacterium]
MLDKQKYKTMVRHKVITPATGYSVVQQWTEPDAPGADDVLSATLLTTAVQTVSTGITNPDFPRALSVTGGDGNVTGNVVITGKNIRGETVTDTIALNGTNTVDGVVAFLSVTSIQLPVYDTAGTETVSVGITDKLGLQSIPWSTTVESEHSGNVADTGGAVLTRDADEIEKCLFDPTSACDASTDKMIHYLSEETDADVSAYTE